MLVKAYLWPLFFFSDAVALDCLKNNNQVANILKSRKKKTQHNELKICISCRATPLQGVWHFCPTPIYQPATSGLITPFNPLKKWGKKTFELRHRWRWPYLQCPVICQHKMEVRCVAQWDVETGRICLFVLFGTGGKATLTPHCFHCSPSLQTPPNKKKFMLENPSFWNCYYWSHMLYKVFHRNEKERKTWSRGELYPPI